MIPRLDTWPAGGSPVYVNVNSSALFPQYVMDSASLAHCAIDNGDRACPSGGWDTLQEQYFDFTVNRLPTELRDIPDYVYLTGPHFFLNLPWAT